MQRALRYLTPAVAAIAVLASCGSTNPSDPPFIVRVTIIEAPDSAGSGDRIQVRVSGTVGPDDCWTLDRVDRSVGPTRLALTFWGRHYTDANCTLAEVRLDYSDTVTVAAPGLFQVVARQPNGTPIVDTVLVR